MPAIPTPKRKYPVRMAIFVNLISKTNDNVKVFAARMGPREVAKIETTERMRRITSRFHRGQFYRYHVSRRIRLQMESLTRGSFGSSLGCGTRMIGTGPEVSHFKPVDPGVAAWGLSGSSKYRVVPY